MAESAHSPNTTHKDTTENQTSSQLFYRGNISYWPFLFLGIIAAGLIGVSSTIDIGLSPASIIAGIVGLYLTLLIIQKPELGAYILIISVFTNISDILTDMNLPSINRPLIALTIGSVLVNYVMKTGTYKQFPTMSRAEWTLVLFYIAIIASVLALPDKSNAGYVIIDITKDILVGVSIYITLNNQELWKKGAMVLLVTVSVVAGLGVIKTATGMETTFFDLARNSEFGQLGSSNELRYGGPIAEPNLWGQVLVSTLPLVLYQFNLKKPITTTALLGISFFLIFLAMIYTGSRGALVALAAIAPLIAYEKKATINQMMIGLLLFAGLLLILPDNYAKRFESLNIFSQNESDVLSEDEAVSGRRNAMLAGLAMFRANPILGVGFSNYGARYWEYAGDLGLESNASGIDTEDPKDRRFAHSLYIEIMSETGLVGIFTFGIFIFTLFNELLRIRREYIDVIYQADWAAWITALTVSILTFLVSGIFLHGIFFRFIWILLGLAMSAISISDGIKSLQSQKRKLS